MTRRSWHGADMADPNSEAPAATRPSPTEIPPSVVTEVGCQSPYRRRRRSATARGRFLEMQKWAEVAEKSGSREWARSMPSDAFRTGAHVRLAPVRIWHPETNEQRHEQSPSGCEDATRAQPVFTILLPREPADRITKRQHASRAALRRADSDRPGVCVIGDATCGWEMSRGMDRRSGRSAVPVAMDWGVRAHWKL